MPKTQFLSAVKPQLYPFPDGKWGVVISFDKGGEPQNPATDFVKDVLLNGLKSYATDAMASMFVENTKQIANPILPTNEVEIFDTLDEALAYIKTTCEEMTAEHQPQPAVIFRPMGGGSFMLLEDEELKQTLKDLPETFTTEEFAEKLGNAPITGSLLFHSLKIGLVKQTGENQYQKIAHTDKEEENFLDKE